MITGGQFFHMKNKQTNKFDWGDEGKFGRTPWCIGGGTQEFPSEGSETVEFLETEFTDWGSC